MHTPQSVAPLPEPVRAWAAGHRVQLYESEQFLVETVVGYLAEGITAGQPLLVIATPEHGRAILEGLRTKRVDVDVLVPNRDILFLDAQETLAKLMEGVAPQRVRFEEIIDAALTQLMADRPYVVVRAFGEMVDLLWQAGNISAAVKLEEMWNDIALRHTFDLLCTYAIRNFASETHSHAFAAVCERHQRVLPTETYLRGDEEQRLRTIAILQQRALVLEAELDHRRELESRLRETLEQRRRVEEELRRRELELRDFLENGLEPMHWVNAQGIIVWVNRAELDLLGYARDEVVGRHIANFHEDRPVIDAILGRLSRGDDLRNVEARLRCKDGSLRRVLINTNVYWQDGKFVHTRCFTRDVTNLQLGASQPQATA